MKTDKIAAQNANKHPTDGSGCFSCGFCWLEVFLKLFLHLRDGNNNFFVVSHCVNCCDSKNDPNHPNLPHNLNHCARDAHMYLFGSQRLHFSDRKLLFVACNEAVAQFLADFD
jgi:hypothetical protein